MQSHLGLICQRYTSNSDVTQITLGFFFSFSTLSLSKSILSDVEEPFGLSVLRDANYMRREKTERWREARTEKKKMRRRCGNTMRQMRGRREEIKGDRRRDITLMILGGFVCMAVM